MYAIAQKLVSRPVEFPLPLCHATNGEFSNDARNKLCRQPVRLAGEEKALAAVAANRNTPEIRNRANPLTNLEHTIF